jgi:phenylacetate-coenzyme A ligase PaaK-like adenylate-forming protein
MKDQIRRNGGCGLTTTTSLAVRVCHAAREKGIDLKGARFMTVGEPLTAAKRKEIETAGAAVCSNYGFTEAGFVGTNCFNPLSEDDTHVFKDSFALIPRRR